MPKYSLYLINPCKRLDARDADKRPVGPLLLFCISFILLSMGALVKGPFIGLDTNDFLRAGARMIELLATGTDSPEQIKDVALFPNYAISSVVLSGIFQSMDLKEPGVIGFNIILFSLIVCMVFSIWRSVDLLHEHRETWRATVIGTLGGFYVLFGLADGFLWSYAILTDIIFLFWVTTFIFFATRGLMTGALRAWGLAILVSGSAVFVRPTGVVLPLLCLFALAIHLLPVTRAYFGRVMLATLLVPAIVVIGVIPWLVLTAVNDPSFVDTYIPAPLQQQFRQAVYFFNSGIIVSNRIEVELSGPLSYKDILTSIVVRLGYYWVPMRIGADPYSFIHNLANAAYMLLTLPILAIGVRRLMGAGKDCRTVLLFLVAVAYWYALLHSVTLVSFDWRYQLPAMVPYWIVTGYGLYYLLGRWSTLCKGQSESVVACAEKVRS